MDAYSLTNYISWSSCIAQRNYLHMTLEGNIGGNFILKRKS